MEQLTGTLSRTFVGQSILRLDPEKATYTAHFHQVEHFDIYSNLFFKNFNSPVYG